MSNIKKLKYPNKSHRKDVKLPKHSEKLAEFFGIMIGDGGINNPWQANITINSEADAGYEKHISNLCSELFGIKPAIRLRKNKKAIVVSLASTSVVDFLVANGLKRGNKLKQNLDIPSWIFNNKKYCIACVRGLFDTDGCMFVHRHKVQGKIYENIELSFRSHSQTLIYQVADILQKSGIMPYISKRGVDVSVYRAHMVVEYLSLFGTSNKRISRVYDKWRDARAV